jgi:pimeloyl-ACP methyl ester carboxylesterase
LPHADCSKRAAIRLAIACYHFPDVRCLSLVLACLVLTACAERTEQSALDRLRPCTVDEGPTDAYCGTYAVYENRETNQGRKIELRIVLLPALSRDAKPDPVFFLAGGPGQGAAELARGIREIFRRVQSERDIVLVDQRGTGKSNPLDCKSDDDSLKEVNDTSEAVVARLKTCMQGLDADLRLYTTNIAMDDLDEVRQFLGYNQINLYGGSYGTRAALVYLRQHEPRVRSVVLDGVAPTDMRLPLFFARDAQRALDLLIADCDKDEQCRARYPQLGERLKNLVARLERSPVTTRLVHPRTGIEEEVVVRGSLLAVTLFGALYSPLASSLIPAIVERAERNDFQGMLALTMINSGVSDNMAVGMQFSVLCTEDFGRFTPQDAEREAANTLFGRHLMETRLEACAFWPKGTLPANYHEPVQSAVPALLLSGALDPVTPPAWAETAAKTLTSSKHLIAPGTGHGVLSTGCGMRIIREFLDAASAQNLDDSCLKLLKRPPFFLSPSGPDPTRASHGEP